MQYDLRDLERPPPIPVFPSYMSMPQPPLLTHLIPPGTQMPEDGAKYINSVALRVKILNHSIH